MAKRTSKPADASFTPDHRLVVLYGPEDALRRARLIELRNVLAAAHGDIDEHNFEGTKAELAEIFDELRGYSLMAAYKLVVVDEADAFVKTHRAALERYAQAPVDHATLVLRSTTWNKGNLDKHIAKVGTIVRCDEPKPAEAQRWLIDRARSEHRVTLEPRAAALLVDRMGTKLGMLDTEVAKLALMALGPSSPNPQAPAADPTITLDLVRQVVGQSSEEKAWIVQEALLNAIRGGDPAQTLGVVRELVELSGQPPVLVMYAAADLLRKLTVASAMVRAGEPEAAVAKAARVWGPQVRPFMQVAKALKPGQASHMLSHALHADARSKSGLGEATLNLECLVVDLADRAWSHRAKT